MNNRVILSLVILLSCFGAVTAVGSKKHLMTSNNSEFIVTNKKTSNNKNYKERPDTADKQKRLSHKSVESNDRHYDKGIYKSYFIAGVSTTCDLPWGPTNIHDEKNQELVD
jgi:hypothetical protein